MALYFQNLCSFPVWVAFVYFDNEKCASPPFRKLGWWEVTAGQKRNVWPTDLRNVGRFVAFFAEEFKDSGGATWSGKGNNNYLIPDVGFDQCFGDNTNCNQQPDFVPLDFSQAVWGELTVMLGPASGQVGVHGPQLFVTPQINPPSFTEFLNYSGNTFPSSIDFHLFVVGMTGRTAPIDIGRPAVDANGNFVSAWSFLCQNSAPSPNVVLEARDVTNNQLIATSNPVSFGCSY